MDEPVTIVDRDVLKVLSVDTRMDILKLLETGERMPSYISNQLGKSAPTIIEHLDTLQKVGLVKKLKHPNDKFVFYSLTEKGEGILRSKTRRLVIILCSSIISFVGSMFFGYIYVISKFSSAMEIMKSEALLRQHIPMEPDNFAQPAINVTMWLVLAILLLAFAIFGFIIYYRKRR